MTLFLTESSHGYIDYMPAILKDTFRQVLLFTFSFGIIRIELVNQIPLGNEHQLSLE